MKAIPLVSVAVITYNHAKVLSQTLEGILMQKCNFDFEIIIGNDCSPDETDEVIHSFKEHILFPKIKYIKHLKNIRPIKNLISVIENSSGKYIAFCEGDDYWIDEAKLQKQIDFLEKNNDYSACFTSRKIINAENEIIAENLTPEKDWDVENIYNEAVVFPLQTLVARNNKDGLIQFLKLFLDSYGADAKMSFYYCKEGKVKSISDFTAVYRHDGYGIWSEKTEKSKLILHINESKKFYKKIVEEKLENKYSYKELEVKLYKRIFKKKIQEFIVNKNTFSFSLYLLHQQKPPIKSIFLAFLDVFVTYYRRKKL